MLLEVRKKYAYGQITDYLIDQNCIGFVRMGDSKHPGLAAVITNDAARSKCVFLTDFRNFFVTSNVSWLLHVPAARRRRRIPYVWTWVKWVRYVKWRSKMELWLPAGTGWDGLSDLSATICTRRDHCRWLGRLLLLLKRCSDLGESGWLNLIRLTLKIPDEAIIQYVSFA